MGLYDDSTLVKSQTIALKGPRPFIGDAECAAYARYRRPDARIYQQLRLAVGDAVSVVNIGSGTGSYEPRDIAVLSIEPSREMRRRNTHSHPRPIPGNAESLPCDDKSFDVAMALMTIHHWSDLESGLLEMRRVARRRLVFLTMDPECVGGFWLGRYVPQTAVVEARRNPALSTIESVLGTSMDIIPLRIPFDCSDLFVEACFGRPELFLRPEVRMAQSVWSEIHQDAVVAGLDRLAGDVKHNGSWDSRLGTLCAGTEYCGSMRILVAEL